ncbi:MAG: retroviral-like aspartic protease family protein [Bacteroidetes bacterium]|nr:retroviral-like aspartic protease family protein [Bacteroidota bacterium]
MTSKLTWGYSLLDGAIIELNAINISNKELSRRLSFLVDTGSDMTVINNQIFNILKLVFIEDVDVTLGGNVKDKWKVSYLAIEIPGMSIREELEVLVCPDNQGDNLLGRDFLIKYVACFDGVNKQFTLQT